MARIRPALQDRNLLFIGNSSHFLASVVSQLTEEGANVFIADKSTKHLNSFIDNLAGQREINPDCGRAFVADFDIENNDQHKSILQKAAEYMGGSDSVIFWNEALEPQDFKQDIEAESIQSFTHRNYNSWAHFLSRSLEFLNTRRNSSVIQIFNESLFNPLPKFELSTANNHARLQLTSSLHSSNNFPKIKFNHIIAGPTEDFLVRWSQGKNTNDALSDYKSHFPKAELLSSSELAKSISFLVGNNSSSPSVERLDLGISK